MPASDGAQERLLVLTTASNPGPGNGTDYHCLGPILSSLCGALTCVGRGQVFRVNDEHTSLLAFGNDLRTGGADHRRSALLINSQAEPQRAGGSQSSLRPNLP